MSRERVHTAPCGFASLDASGVCVYANAEMGAMLGCAPGALVGRELLSLLSDGGKQYWQTHVVPALALNGHVEEVALSLRDASEHDVPVLMNAAQNAHEGGTSLDCVFFGVRQRHTYEQELLMAKRAAEEGHRARSLADRALLELRKLESLSTLAGGVAHTLNNLLAAIVGNADVALLDLPEDHPARESLEEILSAGAQAGELTAQMLAFSGQGRFVLEPVDLTRLARELEPLLASSLEGRVRLALEVDAGVPPVEGDAAQLGQLLTNLVMNAMEATTSPAHPVVLRVTRRFVDQDELVRCYIAHNLPPGEYVVIEVVDRGEGMSTATQGRMFEPFFSTRATGRGLGLPAALGIVRAHRGTVRVRSREGWGTHISVVLPPAASS